MSDALTTSPVRTSGRGRSVPVRGSKALRLLGQRLVQVPLVLLVVSVLVFWLVQVVPGDPGRNALGPYATSAQVAAWNTDHGLDGSVAARYLGWLGGFVTGDWGTSLVYGDPVRPLVLGALSNSLVLGLLAFVVLVPVAIGVGAFLGRREGTRTDRAVTVVLMSLASVPEFVVGVVLLILLAVVVPAFPVQSGGAVGTDPVTALRATALPAVTLALGYVAVLARMTRTGVIDVLASQYYRTAVVKGVSGGALFRRHVARNALIPTISLLGVYLGTLLGGSAVVETLFGYPGLGRLLVTATQRQDVFVLEAGVVVSGLLALLALVGTDLLFTAVDPRVRFSAGSDR